MLAMRCYSRSLLVLLALAAVLSTITTTAAATDAQNVRDVDACRALGFDAESLDCRRCDELSEFLAGKLSPASAAAIVDSQASAAAVQRLSDECKHCCLDLSGSDLVGGHHSGQYTRVVLEVCTCKFGRYPRIANFVHEHAKKHARLEIEYINARHPFLIFYDADGNKKEEVGIASWDEDTISEFIQAKVKSDTEDEEPQEQDATTTLDAEKHDEEVETDEPDVQVAENDEL